MDKVGKVPADSWAFEIRLPTGFPNGEDAHPLPIHRLQDAKLIQHSYRTADGAEGDAVFLSHSLIGGKKRGIPVFS